MRNLSKIEKRQSWEDSINLNQLDGEYKPSKELLKLIENEINGEITTDDIVKILTEKYSKTY